MTGTLLYWFQAGGERPSPESEPSHRPCWCAKAPVAGCWTDDLFEDAATTTLTRGWKVRTAGARDVACKAGAN